MGVPTIRPLRRTPTLGWRLGRSGCRDRALGAVGSRKFQSETHSMQDAATAFRRTSPQAAPPWSNAAASTSFAPGSPSPRIHHRRRPNAANFAPESAPRSSNAIPDRRLSLTLSSTRSGATPIRLALRVRSFPHDNEPVDVRSTELSAGLPCTFTTFPGGHDCTLKVVTLRRRIHRRGNEHLG